MTCGRTEIQGEAFGRTADGREVTKWRFSIPGRVEMDVLDYGGIVQSLRTPDCQGRFADITCGYDDLRGYEEEQPFFGALVGRFANRIANGRFSLDGKEYRLPLNNAPGGIPCSLHGGERAFHNSIWEVEPFEDVEKCGLVLRLEQADGDQGYPGKLSAKVVYTLRTVSDGESQWRVDYEATCDRPTPVNFTQHIFFHLNGPGTGDICGHTLQLFADAFTPVTQGLIPTGEIRPVAGTPFDFREAHAIGKCINGDDEQLRNCGGYDTNFVLRGYELGQATLRPAAVLASTESGRVVRIHTTEPGLQLYTGNFLTEKDRTKEGPPLGFRGALALETQHFPDSPNQPHFPTAILRPGEVFRSSTTWNFGLL